MDLRQRTVEDVEVLTPLGRIDAASSEALRTGIGTMIAGGRCRIVLDMSSVDFIDSSGLGVLVASLRTAKRDGGVLKIAALNGNVRQLFELMRLDRVFELFTDVDKSLESF